MCLSLEYLVGPQVSNVKDQAFIHAGPLPPHHPSHAWVDKPVPTAHRGPLMSKLTTFFGQSLPILGMSSPILRMFRMQMSCAALMPAVA